MKITDPDDLVVSTTSGNLGVNGNIWLDTSAKTFELAAYGSLAAKDGVTGNALWAKFVDLWTTATYQPYGFPMTDYDARSGQFIFGRDPGGTYNGWKPANDTTRQMIRDAGWSEYSSGGVLNRQYVGIVALASGYPAGAQFYYQKSSGGTATSFTYTDAPNEGIQVYGDASNGNFDSRTYFRLFCREYNYTYDDAVLSDVGETATGAYKIQLPISVAADSHIQANDATVGSSTPYTNLSITYYGSNQMKDVGGTTYPFRIIVDNTTANATLEQIYTYLQYELRQSGDIDAGAGTVVGKTADSLGAYAGDILYTAQDVYIDGVLSSEKNDIVFTDHNGVQRTYPFVATVTITFSSNLTTSSTGFYRIYFTNDDAGDNLGYDYGTANAITVQDASSNNLTGTITSSTLTFYYDYGANTQRGASSAGTDAPITIVAVNPAYAKPKVVQTTLTESANISILVTADTDLAYIP